MVGSARFYRCLSPRGLKPAARIVAKSFNHLIVWLSWLCGHGVVVISLL